MKEIIRNENNLKETDVTEVVKRVKLLIINSKDEILLGYSHNDYQFPGGHVEMGEDLLQTLGYSHNDYQFPGGHVEMGEDLLQTVKREIMEETGIVLNNLNINPFAKMIGYYKDWPEKGKNRKIEIYYYELKTDEKPNLNNTSYTEIEKDGNFELRYIPVNDVEEELKENAEKYGDKKGITKEMLELLSIYKNLKNENK